MVNAWSLLYSEMNGTMDEDYPIMSKDDDVTIVGGDGDDTITFTASGMVGGADTIPMDWGAGEDHIAFDHIAFGTASSDTLNIGTPIPGGMGVDTLNLDFSGIAGTQYDDNKYYVDGYDPYPTLGSTKPQPNLKYQQQKYGEDKGIADLKDYVSSTYSGHYTNDGSDVQTLDLIHSVGDAESFCRSNALKYLSRYDKKGSAKRDILKAMHYCLLLYYFSGNTQDPDTTNTRYETF